MFSLQVGTGSLYHDEKQKVRILLAALKALLTQLTSPGNYPTKTGCFLFGVNAILYLKFWSMALFLQLLQPGLKYMPQLALDWFLGQPKGPLPRMGGSRGRQRREKSDQERWNKNEREPTWYILESKPSTLINQSVFLVCPPFLLLHFLSNCEERWSQRRLLNLSSR